MSIAYGNNNNRDSWEFEYTAQKLAVAAQEQFDYRISRVKAWTAKKEEVMENIKGSGITVHESIAEKMAYSNAARGGAQVIVDPTMQKDLDECMEKISTHRKYADEYNAWIQVLKANPETRLKLKHSDWQFFFGKV